MKHTLGNFQNQYLNRVYLTTREGVYLQHHKAFSYGEQRIEVPDDILLIDLGDKKGKVSMVRLYQADKIFGVDSKNDLKLVSYHISYTSQLAAFFFIKRNLSKASGLYTSQSDQSGVEFMVVHKISKLVQMARDFEEGREQGYVLSKNQPIFIFGSNVKKLIFTNYDHEIVMKYQDNSKSASLMASTLVHEMVYDPINPMDKTAAFLFSSEKSRKPTPVFQWYLCFMDLTVVQAFLEQAVFSNNKVQVFSFDQFFDVFHLKEMEDPFLSKASRSEDATRYENSRTRDCPLFCRSSPWTTVMEPESADRGRDFEDVLLVGVDNEEYRKCT